MYYSIVGYQNKAARKEGFNLICATFKSVDGSPLNLNCAKPGSGFSWENGDTIMFLDHGGGTRVREDGYKAMYTYFTEGDGAPSDGWYQYDAATEAGDFLAIEAADDFSYGAGAVVQASETTANIVFSGAVAKGPQTIIAAKEGFNIIGNPTPVNLTLFDITPSSGFSWENGDTIMFLDHGGGTYVREDGYKSMYTYFTEGDGAPADGWYQYDAATESGEFLAPEEAENDLQAGDAFVAQTSETTAGIQFKAALPAED